MQHAAITTDAVFFFGSTQQPSPHMIDNDHLQPTAIASKCTRRALYTPLQVFRYTRRHRATGDNNRSTYGNWYVWIVCFPWNIPHLAICLASTWVTPIVWYPVCHWKYQLLDVFQVHVGWMPFLNTRVETCMAVILGQLTVCFSALHPQLTAMNPAPTISVWKHSVQGAWPRWQTEDQGGPGVQ